MKLIVKARESCFLTNLGILFSDQKQNHFPYAKIECARFKGKTTEVFLDQATFDNDIIGAIENAMEFIKRNIKLGATIGDIYRENRWEYPLLGIREILINAVVHRDYAVQGSDIKVAIFDDMIEITSPGVLIIDKAKIGKGYSELRNPNLGSLFKKLNIIEQWGTGFQKINHELSDYPDIIFEVDDHSSFVQVKFIKRKTTQKTTQKKTRPAVSTKEKICALLQEKPELTQQSLAKLIGVSASAIKQHLADLKKSGLIERKGSDRAGYWKVSNFEC